MKTLRLLSIFLLLLLPSSLALSQNRVKKVGLAWVGRSGMSNRVAKGFYSGISELSESSIQIEFRKELTSTKVLSHVVSLWEKDKDAMIILRSNGAKWLASHTEKIPTFIGGCNHPVELGTVTDLSKTKRKIAGVTYYVPAEIKLKKFIDIIPSINSVMLLVEYDHPSSKIDQSETKAFCEKNNILYFDHECTSKENIIEIVRENRSKVSVFILGSQAIIMDSASQIVANSGKTPVLSYNAKGVLSGALCGYSADDIKLGHQLSKQVIDVLVKGIGIETIGIETDSDPTFYVNLNTAKKLNFIFPKETLLKAKKIK